AGPAAAQAPLKVGFVYVSPIGDAGWTFQHDQGRKEMEKALAGKVETKYVENVPEGPDAERVIREFATNGYQRVFAKSFGYVNPKAEVRVIWTNSWYDPGREREAANTLISQGADVLTHHTDSTAVVQAAEEKGKYAFGYHSDMSKYGPKAELSATTHQWGAFY